jgi:biotin operon repressor
MQEGQRVMSQAERDRLVALKKAKKKLITQREAAGELGLSVRQVKRLIHALKEHGDEALVHGLRGRPSNRKMEANVRQEAVRDLVGAGVCRIRADSGGLVRIGDRLTRAGIEDECTTVVVLILVEIKHSHDRPTRQDIKGLRVANGTEPPIAFDKAQDGGEIVQAMVYVVRSGVGRYQQKGHPHPKSAAIVISPRWQRARTAGTCSSRATLNGVVERVSRLIDDGARHVIVPAVGIIIRNDNRRICPERALLNRIDRSHDRSLLQQRGRIGGMTGIALGELQEGHRRQVPSRKRLIKIT